MERSRGGGVVTRHCNAPWQSAKKRMDDGGGEDLGCGRFGVSNDREPLASDACACRGSQLIDDSTRVSSVGSWKTDAACFFFPFFFFNEISGRGRQFRAQHPMCACFLALATQTCNRLRLRVTCPSLSV